MPADTTSKMIRAQERARALEDEIARVDKEQDRVIEALVDAVEKVGKGGKPKRRRGTFLWLVGAAGVAYVLGAKAGRERYEQIMAKLRGMRSSATRDLTDTGTDPITAL